MGFLIQDLLDYAQIKQGKFRTSIKKFNVRTTIEKVISIMREKAQDQELYLRSEFENILEAEVANDHPI